jgi:AraC-like DNA-binding protein
MAKEWERMDKQQITPLFAERRASEWLAIAATMPKPRMLFDCMWYEGDLCILFADTNVGKSILAVQIGDSISRGVPIKGFGMTAPSQPVAYFDFELSVLQFRARYTDDDTGSPYPFHDHFSRIELDATPDYEQWGFKTFEGFLHHQLEQYIQRTGIKVLIIDNLTYLRSEMEHAKDAYSLMNMLINLKRKYALSMLVLAHTPKRDNSKPIEVNHLQGSKQIANLCDSIIALGKSHKDLGLRYLKQIKHRLGEKQYEEDNVCVCQLGKSYDMLQFELIAHGRERDHLQPLGDKDLGARIASVKDLAASGMTQRDIAKQLGISSTTVNRLLKDK